MSGEASYPEIVDDSSGSSLDEFDLHNNYPYRKPLHFLTFSRASVSQPFQPQSSRSDLLEGPRTYSEAGKTISDFYASLVDVKVSTTNSETFCPHCKISFTESAQDHCLSIGHQFSTAPKPEPKYGIPANNRGYQMLLDTGWTEEQGLGKDGEGVIYPVAVRLKTDRKAGLGVETSAPRITHVLKEPARVPPISRTERKQREREKLRLEGAITRDLRKYLATDAELHPLDSDVFMQTLSGKSSARKKSKRYD